MWLKISFLERLSSEQDHIGSRVPYPGSSIGNTIPSSVDNVVDDGEDWAWWRVEESLKDDSDTISDLPMSWSAPPFNNDPFDAYDHGDNRCRTRKTKIITIQDNRVTKVAFAMDIVIVAAYNTPKDFGVFGSLGVLAKWWSVLLNYYYMWDVSNKLERE